MIRLSYVVQADAWETLADTIVTLAGQTRAAAVELVAVAPAGLGAPPPAAGALGAITTVEHPLVPVAEARAAGIEAARGDVVAIGETHVTFGPEWVERTLRAHDAGADVVVPPMASANPSSRLGWAAFLLDYGRYRDSTPDVTVPTYNATVRRAALPAGPALATALRPGPYLDAALRGATVARGEVEARHLNVDVPRHWVRERFLAGVLIGGVRAARWGRARALAYAAASPLIALTLLARALRLDRSGAPRGTLATIALACAVEAAGEAVGYVGLARPAHERRMAELELHKRRFARAAA